MADSNPNDISSSAASIIAAIGVLLGGGLVKLIDTAGKWIAQYRDRQDRRRDQVLEHVPRTERLLIERVDLLERQVKELMIERDSYEEEVRKLRDELHLANTDKIRMRDELHSLRGQVQILVLQLDQRGKPA